MKRCSVISCLKTEPFGMSTEKIQKNIARSLIDNHVNLGNNSYCDHLADLKLKVKEVLQEELLELKSGVKPSIATKIYPWRHYLFEDNKPFHQDNSEYTRSATLIPNKRLHIYHDPSLSLDHFDDSIDPDTFNKVRNVDGCYKVIPKIYVRPDDSLKYFSMTTESETKDKLKEKEYYSLNWALEDTRSQRSIKDFVKGQSL